MTDPEKREGEIREMTFKGEDVAYLLRENIKMLTLRMPDPKYDFKKGEVIVADCVDTNEKVRLVVVDNVKKPLEEYDNAELIMDGYLGDGSEWGESAAMVAAKDLASYGGRYAEVTVETELQGIVTISEELFLSMPEKRQNELLRRGLGAMNDIDRPFNDVFWPSWCRWIIAKGGGLNDYWDFLLDNDYAYLYEISQVTEEFSADVRCLMHEEEQLLEVWNDKESNLYRAVVLLEDAPNPEI